MKNMGNMMGMMKKAQKMQADMNKMQEALKAMTFDGEAASGVVKVQLTGQGYANSISIDNSLMVEEDKEDLEDLIIVAFNSAKDAMEKHVADETDRIMGDLQLPPGFKMPM
jgi:nucleoid-associated protein EbfC